MNQKLNREARILRNRRTEIGMTQTDVALGAGIQLQQYQRFENGLRPVASCSFVLALRICATLEIDPYDLAFENSSDWTKNIR